MLLHGIGNTMHAWDELIPMLPERVRVVGVDLLGFGRSPKPSWATYNVRAQAHSVMVTLAKLGVRRRVIFVGHSLGALAAVELARRYPLAVRQLILCSPPFYHADGRRDKALKRLYREAVKYPAQMKKLSRYAVQTGLANKALSINDENISAYFGTLEASIVNQTSMDDAARLKTPTRILYGTLDPVVIGKNIVTVAKNNSAVSTRKLLVGHEVLGTYTKAVAKEVEAVVLALGRDTPR